VFQVPFKIIQSSGLHGGGGLSTACQHDCHLKIFNKQTSDFSLYSFFSVTVYIFRIRIFWQSKTLKFKIQNNSLHETPLYITQP